MKPNAVLLLLVSAGCCAAELAPKPGDETEGKVTVWPARKTQEMIETDLKLEKTQFNATEPIIVDVYVENPSAQDVRRNQFSPESSSVGLPKFEFVRVSDGKKTTLPPGLFGDDWDAWYQPASGWDAHRVDGFILPAGRKIQALHGTLWV